jgi:hypothetical protein
LAASEAQVFGPATVTVDYSTTGDIPLLTMQTTLPAGGYNIIMAVYKASGTGASTGNHRLRIYKGSTLLYGSLINQIFSFGGMQAKAFMIIAVDTNPSGNDVYTFVEYSPTSESATATVHVQGIVIKSDDVVWGYNSATVDVANNTTATLVNINTNFPTGSKVAVIGVAYFIPPSSGTRYVGAGNARLKSGATVLSSNETSIGAGSTSTAGWIHLLALHTTTSNTQTYSFEVYNNSGVTLTFASEIIAFTVADGAFLDSSEVQIYPANTWVTIGNLTTSISSEVVAICIATHNNYGTSSVTLFNAGNVSFQLNNSFTNQVTNLVNWLIQASGQHGSSGMWPFFRIDRGVSNPSYQLKMRTSLWGSYYGEAKILAFSGIGIRRSIVEACNITENIKPSMVLVRKIVEGVNVVEGVKKRMHIVRKVGEVVNVVETVRKSMYLFRLVGEVVRIYEQPSKTMKKVRVVVEQVRVVESSVYRIFKTYIKKLVSMFRGRAKGGGV